MKQCAECQRYLDDLTDDAVRHPIYTNLCVACGAQAVVEDGYGIRDQYRREAALGLDPRRKGKATR